MNVNINNLSHNIACTLHNIKHDEVENRYVAILTKENSYVAILKVFRSEKVNTHEIFRFCNYLLFEAITLSINKSQSGAMVLIRKAPRHVTGSQILIGVLENLQSQKHLSGN